MEEAGAASTTSPPPPPPIAQLGYDQVLSVLRLLPPDAVLSFAATCRTFRAWASSDALWEALCRRDWGARAAAALAERRRERGRGVPWRRVYAEVAWLGALSARRVPMKRSASPRPRASHSLNLVAGWLVLFGGGCEGALMGMLGMELAGAGGVHGERAGATLGSIRVGGEKRHRRAGRVQGNDGLAERGHSRMDAGIRLMCERVLAFLAIFVTKSMSPHRSRALTSDATMQGDQAAARHGRIHMDTNIYPLSSLLKDSNTGKHTPWTS
ncbi:hypothetical protein ACP70R_000238 [Stipagrostis hirtigluma subsp. patula]